MSPDNFLSNPDDTLSESDEEFIPQGDAFEAEDNLEENSDGDCKIRNKMV